MTGLSRLASASLALLLACAAHLPRWDPAAVTVVRLLKPHSREERVVTDGGTIEELIACLSRAEKVDRASGADLALVLDIGRRGRDGSVIGDRFLYDAASGELARRTYPVRPAFRLREADRARFAALLAADAGPTE